MQSNEEQDRCHLLKGKVAGEAADRDILEVVDVVQTLRGHLGIVLEPQEAAGVEAVLGVAQEDLVAIVRKGLARAAALEAAKERASAELQVHAQRAHELKEALDSAAMEIEQHQRYGSMMYQ
jgi:hypothetical protein